MDSIPQRSLSRKVEKMSPIVKEKNGLEAGKAMVPHYQWPTANSSNRAREKFKPLTQFPPHFTQSRNSSLGLVSSDSVRKSSLLGCRTSEKNPMQINGLKPSKSLEKTALKMDAPKPSRAPELLKSKTPNIDLCSKVLNVSHCVKTPSVKQFLAYRRTQNNITPLPARVHCAETGHATSEAMPSLKAEDKEPDGCISAGSVSDVSAYDLIEQSASCQDMYDQSEHTEQQCSVLINALGTDCSSQRDSEDGIFIVSFSQINLCPKVEAVEKHDYVSGSVEAEMASKVNADGHTKQFVEWEDNQCANGRQGNETTELDSSICGSLNPSCSGDDNQNCHIPVGTSSVQCSSNTEVDSPQKFRQGRVYPLDNQNSEAGKAGLRHHMTEERRPHEWLLDYAFTNIVKKLSSFKKLSPFRRKKVEPLSKCETKKLREVEMFSAWNCF